MGCPAQRSTDADAVSGRTATNVTARSPVARGWRALPRGIALGLAAALVPVALSACGSTPAMAPGTASVVSAPVRIAHTRLGAVGYRAVGSGPPLVLIMGYSGTMEVWDPRLVHALARHNRVVMFDNAGVGRTQPLHGEQTATLTIDAMADQTSALIGTLGLGRPDVLGWSMGGMIAQALAVLHPAQVRRLVLCATYPGTGAGALAGGNPGRPPLSCQSGQRRQRVHSSDLGIPSRRRRVGGCEQGSGGRRNQVVGRHRRSRTQDRQDLSAHAYR